MPTTPVETSLTALELARTGRFAEIRDLFAPSLLAMVAPEALRAAWEAEVDRQGEVSSVGAPVSEPPHAGVVVVKIPVSCERGALTFIVSVTQTGHLTGLQLAPPSAAQPVAPWEPPHYADPDAFDEHDLSLSDGPLAVSATLSLPRQPGLRPGVVLLPGSGPQDRDETIGRNKPLKDLAWGLATCGIAVLRFDKITFANPAAVRGADQFTVADEYGPQATAAIHQLRQHPAVDPERLFLLGHSLGGTVAPRLAAGEPSIAGLIILAGGAQPLHWAAVRQFEYLAALNPDTAAASATLIESLRTQATLVDGPDLSTTTPTADLPFGAPASYWLDLRAYQPVSVAAGLDKPMLILQGDRDYQVTVEDDLARWRAELADRSDVTIRTYPADNHLFFPGTGTSTPAEYEPAQHVDPAVVADIVTWLTTQSTVDTK